jgi:digeranylgeranylglycerophospholipid reductase
LRTEAVVVGAGPAGLIAAEELARRGFGVKVFEEHGAIGEPRHCAGVLSVEGLRRLNVESHHDFVQQDVRGGTAYSPGGIAITIPGGRTRAYAVDRSAFDRYLADSARDQGAEIETGRRVREFLVRDGRVAGVVCGEHATECGLVIDCEGAGGVLARSFGLPRPSEGVLAGVNVELRGVEVEPKMVEIWLGEKVAPGLFAWVIPVGEDAVRCGLACGRGDAREMLRGFLRRRFGEIEHPETRVWPVLTGGPVSKTFGDGLLLVGDVAAQTKPTTGGGVMLGGLCAVEAARAAAEALEAGDASAGFLSRYERSWRAALGKEFSTMLSVRRFLNRIPDDRMDRLFESVKASGLEPALGGLVEEGDMDMQSGVLRSALGNPGLLRVAVECLGRVALGELRALFNL